jgi:hypothetical protein
MYESPAPVDVDVDDLDRLLFSCASIRDTALSCRVFSTKLVTPLSIGDKIKFEQGVSRCLDRKILSLRRFGVTAELPSEHDGFDTEGLEKQLTETCTGLQLEHKFLTRMLLGKAAKSLCFPGTTQEQCEGTNNRELRQEVLRDRDRLVEKALELNRHLDHTRQQIRKAQHKFLDLKHQCEEIYSKYEGQTQDMNAVASGHITQQQQRKLQENRVLDRLITDLIACGSLHCGKTTRLDEIIKRRIT